MLEAHEDVGDEVTILIENVAASHSITAAPVEVLLFCCLPAAL